MKGFLFVVALLFATLPGMSQDCVNGKCFKSHSDRVVGAVVSVASAPVRIVEHVVCEVQPVRSLVGCTAGSLAQWKAERQAAEGRMRHVGGGFGGGRYEGVGFSTASADDAIRACCYWDQRPVREIGVARGRRGWYATVIYN